MKKILLTLLISTILPLSLMGQEPPENFYEKGKIQAQLNYDSRMTTFGGIVTGFYFGLIGWSLGNIALSMTQPKIPNHYTHTLNAYQKHEFERGYSDYVQEYRRDKFGYGTAIGITAFIFYIIQTADEHQPTSLELFKIKY